MPLKLPAARPGEGAIRIERDPELSDGTIQDDVTLAHRVAAAIFTVFMAVVAGLFAAGFISSTTNNPDAGLGIAIVIWISGLLFGVMQWRRGRLPGLRSKGIERTDDAAQPMRRADRQAATLRLPLASRSRTTVGRNPSEGDISIVPRNVRQLNVSVVTLQSRTARNHTASSYQPPGPSC